MGCLGLSAARMPSVGLPLGTVTWPGSKATRPRRSLFKTHLGVSLRRKSETGWLGFEGRGSGQEAVPLARTPAFTWLRPLWPQGGSSSLMCNLVF